MKLDSEDQRQQLLVMLMNARIEGTFEALAATLPEMQRLIDTVRQAPLEAPDEEEKKDA